MASRPVFEAALSELHHSTDGHDIRAAASGVAAAAKEEGKVFARRCGGALEALLAALKRHGEEEDIVVALISAAGAVVEFPAFGDTSLAFDVLEAVLRTVDSLSLSATVQQRACEAMDLLLGPYDTWVRPTWTADGEAGLEHGAHNRVGYDGHGAPLRSQDSRAPALAAACCAAVRKALRTHATNPGVLSSGLAAISKLGVVQVVADALKEDGIVEELFGITRRLPSMAGDIEGSTLSIPMCVALSAAWSVAAGLWDSSAGVKQEVLDGALSLLTAFKTQPQELGGVFQLLAPVVETAACLPAILAAVSATPGVEGAAYLLWYITAGTVLDGCNEGTADFTRTVVKVMLHDTSSHDSCIAALENLHRQLGAKVVEDITELCKAHHLARLRFIEMLGVAWRQWRGTPPPPATRTTGFRRLFRFPWSNKLEELSELQRLLALRRVCRVRGEDAEGMAAEVVEPFGREVCLFL